MLRGQPLATFTPVKLHEIPTTRTVANRAGKPSASGEEEPLRGESGTKRNLGEDPGLCFVIGFGLQTPARQGFPGASGWKVTSRGKIGRAPDATAPAPSLLSLDSRGFCCLPLLVAQRLKKASTSDAVGGERSNVPRSAAFCRRRSTLQGPLAISRTVALRCWGSCPYPRLQATTSGAALTSKPISGGSTWVTPHRCAARRRFSS
jgi:hypothetical protein